MKFDIDISELVPGCAIEQSTCEQIIGVARKANQYAFQFALMQLGDYVMKLLWKDGKQWTVKTEDGCVQVLTHEQASEYNSSRFKLAIGKMRRCHKRLVAVDAGELPADKRGQHADEIVKQSRMLMALRETKRDLVPVATVRAVPVRRVK